jgi:hypothetical protein
MNRLASVRVGALFAAVVVSSVTGCNCAPPPNDCSDLVIDTTPANDATDVNQVVDVVANFRRGPMTSVPIATAKFQVRAAGDTDFGAAADGMISNATATFAGRMFKAGQNTFKVTLTEQNSTCTVTRDVSITVKETVMAPPVIMGCDFPQDANGDGTLNGSELPGGAGVIVRVRTTAGTGAGATFSAPNGMPAQATLMGDTAQVTVPAPVNDGTFTVTGTVARGAAMPTCNPSIRIQRTAACTVENTTDQSPRGPMNDADMGTAGFQVRTTATRVSGMVARATMRLGMETRMLNLAAMATASADFTVASMGTQSYMVTLEASDSAGNACTVTNATRNVPVDFDAPVVTIAAPTSADGGPVLITRSPVAVVANVGMGDNGATACAFLGTMQVDCAPVANGAVVLSVPFSADGVRTITVRITDAAGNVGSASTSVDVVLSGCGITFFAPATNPALVIASQAPGGNFTFRTASKGVCVGQPARLSRATVSADGGASMFTVVGNASLTARSLSDGGTDAVAAFTTPVSSGDFIFRAEVDNLADGGSDNVNVDVTVDLEGPAITSPVVPSGQPRAIINAQQDSNPAVPGAQRILTFNGRIPSGGRADICTTQMFTGAVEGDCGTGWFRLAQNVTSPANAFTFPEGSYDLKVVIVAGATRTESPAVPVTVDSIRPCVLANSVRFPQDTNMDGRLNAMELGSNAPRLEFQLDPACGDLNLSSLSASGGVTVREVVSGAPLSALNVAGDVSFDTGTGRVRVNLTQSIASERDYTFFVQLQDLATNTNLFTPTANPAVASVRVDRTAPNCDLVAPTLTTLNRTNVPGGSLGVTIATAADVGMNGVTVTLQGLTAQNVTPSGAANQATATFTGLTGTNTRTLDATCRDAAGNTASITQRALVIDLDEPTCSIVAPNVSNSPYSDLSITTTVNVTGADGRTVTVSSSEGGTRGTLTVTSGVATGPITYANGTQNVSVSVSDTAGNTCSATVNNIVINSADCGLTLTNAFSNSNGSWFNRSNTGSLTANSGTATITAQTSSCTAGRMVTLVRTAPTAGTPITVADVSGTATFSNVALADGETWTVSAPNGARPATVATFRVDLDAPVFGVGPTQLGQARINGTLLASAAPTFFVAAADNRNVETATAGYFADLNAGTAGAQANVVVDGIEAFDFGLNGIVRVLFKGAELTSQPVTAAAQTVSFTGGSAITLPHNDSGAFVVRVTDGAGNSSEWTSTSTIDVIAPAAPPGFTNVVANARRGEVNVSWDPAYDDGSTSTSGTCQYELAWTTSSVPGNGSLGTRTLFFGGSATREPLVAHSSTRISRTVTLPPLNTYFIKVLARDEAGNYSDYGTVPAGLANLWTAVTISNPSTDTTATSHNFGQYLAGGVSLNNDGVPDLVVGAPNRGPMGSTNRGSVYVYYGATGFSAQTTCTAPGCQELQPPTDSTASGLFGIDISTGGNVGDVGSENKPDLLVSQTTWQTSVGRAFLWFGANAAQVNAASFVEFRGAGAGSNYASTAKIIKDIDGDGLDEIALSAHSELANVGRVYIFKGRSADPNFMAATPRSNWFNSRTATDGTNSFIPAAEATWIIEGPAGGPNDFGRFRNGLVSVGALDTSTLNNNNLKNYFVIPMSRETRNRIQLVSGPGLSALSGTVVNTNTAALVQTIQVTAPGSTPSTQLIGFSRSVAAGIDFSPGSGPDIVVGYPAQARVYVIENFGPTGIAGGAAPPEPTITISAGVAIANQFGTHVSAGDLNGDGRADLIVGESRLSGGRAWVLWQRTGTFDNLIDGTAPRFWISSLEDTTATSRLGRMTGLVDVNGDGALDVVLGDETGTGTGSGGKVTVWR